MRFLTTTEWTVKRGMLLAGLVVTVCSILSTLFPWWVMGLLAAVLVASCLIPSLRHPIWVFIVVWASVFLCLFGWFHLSSVKPMCDLVGREDTIRAQVVDLPSSGHMVTVEILDADTLSRGDRVLLYCNEQAMPKLHQAVGCHVVLKELYPTQQSYRADGVFLQAYPTTYNEEAVTLSETSRSWRTMLAPLR